jgi:hypothetical protein
VEKRMTDFTLVASSQVSEDKELSHYDILIGGRKVGVATVFYATEEEMEMFRKKLKKRIKVGEAYTVKIILDEKYNFNKPDLVEIRDNLLKKYTSCDSSKILFARNEGGKIIPLTDGSRLEGLEIGTS